MHGGHVNVAPLCGRDFKRVISGVAECLHLDGSAEAT